MKSCENSSNSNSEVLEVQNRFVNQSHTVSSGSTDESSPRCNNSTPGSNESYDKQFPCNVSRKSDKLHVSTEEVDFNQNSLEKTLTEDNLSKITEIFSSISKMSDRSKLGLMLRLFKEESENCREYNYELNQTLDNGINQAEHNKATDWVTTNLEEDKETCLKKQEVYEEYKKYCEMSNIRYLTTADFGKVMRKVFPNIKHRRLGSRGQSKYCYSGLKMSELRHSPHLIDICANLKKTADELEKNGMADSDDKCYDKNNNNNNLDLSSVAEYELSSDILIESAVILIEYLKSQLKNDNICSLKDAVKLILINREVDMSSAHVKKLVPHLNTDESPNGIKTESQYSSPASTNKLSSQSNSVQSVSKANQPTNNVPHSYSTSNVDHSPNLSMNLNSSYYSSVSANEYTSNNNISNSNSTGQMYYSYTTQDSKPLNPCAYSTPIKRSRRDDNTPQLSSPLLDKNPKTNKKLDLSTQQQQQQQRYFPQIPLVMPQQHHQQLSPVMSTQQQQQHQYAPLALDSRHSGLSSINNYSPINESNHQQQQQHHHHHHHHHNQQSILSAPPQSVRSPYNVLPQNLIIKNTATAAAPNVENEHSIHSSYLESINRDIDSPLYDEFIHHRFGSRSENTSRRVDIGLNLETCSNLSDESQTYLNTPYNSPGRTPTEVLPQRSGDDSNVDNIRFDVCSRSSELSGYHHSQYANSYRLLESQLVKLKHEGNDGSSSSSFINNSHSHNRNILTPTDQQQQQHALSTSSMLLAPPKLVSVVDSQNNYLLPPPPQQQPGCNNNNHNSGGGGGGGGMYSEEFRVSSTTNNLGEYLTTTKGASGSNNNNNVTDDSPPDTATPNAVYQMLQSTNSNSGGAGAGARSGGAAGARHILNNPDLYIL